MGADTNSFRTPLARVRGLGSAKSGTGHFIAQRVTAIALVPLTLWFVIAVAGLTGASHATAVEFLSHPVNAVLMLAFTLTGIYHFMLGLQVVIEDYIPGHGMRIALLLANAFFAGLAALACVLAILKLAL
jgi:succinate dehydrogenase / fumarate reductase membrane anchor subunit